MCPWGEPQAKVFRTFHLKITVLLERFVAHISLALLKAACILRETSLTKLL